jgi:hypothetical protein
MHFSPEDEPFQSFIESVQRASLDSIYWASSIRLGSIHSAGIPIVSSANIRPRSWDKACCSPVQFCTSTPKKNIGTKEQSKEYETCQFFVGERIDTVMRICFPTNGKYKVMAFAGRRGETRNGCRELIYTDSEWLFDVSGVPVAKRRLCQLITGRPFMPLKCPDTFRIEPVESYVRIPGTSYNFKCSFRGEKITINGREPDGEDKHTFFPTKKEVPGQNRWKSLECTLEYPSHGVWRLMFWIDNDFICTQTIIAGSAGALSLTGEEKAALSTRHRPR